MVLVAGPPAAGGYGWFEPFGFVSSVELLVCGCFSTILGTPSTFIQQRLLRLALSGIPVILTNPILPCSMQSNFSPLLFVADLSLANLESGI